MVSRSRREPRILDYLFRDLAYTNSSSAPGQLLDIYCCRHYPPATSGGEVEGAYRQRRSPPFHGRLRPEIMNSDSLQRKQ